ncbi:NAD-dependent epimerase/dehydratase family protein [Cedecea neteri]|uniref:NAD-dependent epimerase/dehydratase family protein n=1 Tax=Cedecea neteri TaxID=158822 RepID=UPI0004F75D50|nr:NAD-dependent epimerase/dehydratase family protein [Cedecea neteri]AIR63783.1 semialdehyde dehydrogenase [Cedecea neteri]
MKIVIVGSGGMVGQGVLLASLAAKDVTDIILLVRTQPAGEHDPRIRYVVNGDLLAFDAADPLFRDVDACFFCAGISSSGVSEAKYRQITYDMTLRVAEQLKSHSPQMKFVYVSGAGADSSGKSSQMWARVRGEVENALLALFPGKAAIFRPAFILPTPEVQSRTPAYRLFYTVIAPVMRLISATTGKRFLSIIDIGNAMLNITRFGVNKTIMAKPDIVACADRRN